MPLLRHALLKSVSVLVLTLTVAACTAAGATTLVGGTPGSPTPTAAAATATETPIVSQVATVAATANGTAPATGGTTGDTPNCAGGQTGRQAFTMSGFQAAHFCGPANARVTAAGMTAQITSGWCETNSAGFSVSIGTQLFGSPSASQEPDVLIILVDPNTGAGSISGVVGHHHFLLTTSPVSFGAGKQSGTFSGTDQAGGAISGSFTCTG
jgi:hypothetical protein